MNRLISLGKAIALRHGLLALGMAPCALPSPSAGASVQWVRHEAEACTLLGGARVEGPSFEVGTFAAESSGRKCVRLGAAGDGISFTAGCDFDGMVLRVSIPDAPMGGGTEDVLRVTILGAERLIPLTSRYVWQYGAEHVGKGEFSNEPPEPGYVGPLARMRFDDARALLPVRIPAGTPVRIDRPSSSKAAWIYLDLVEIESAPPPIAPPAGAVSVLDFGAKASPGFDSAPAFSNALEAARTRGVAVYVPAGRFRIGTGLSLGETTLRGAGMWRSELHFTGSNARACGFAGRGGAARVSDLFIEGDLTWRGGTRGFCGWYGPGSEIRSVWIEHVTVGAWIADYWDGGTNTTRGLSILGCRVRNTFADGVNFAKGTSSSRIEGCHFRGNMDDAMASWSSDSNRVPRCAGNRFASNTAECVLRAGGVGIFGGAGHELVGNRIADTLVEAGLRFNTVFPGHPFDEARPMVAEGNLFLRCGGITYGRKNGAIGLSTAARMGALVGVVLTGNTIIDSPHAGISIDSSEKFPVGAVRVASNLIVHPTGCGLGISDRSAGSIEWVGNRVEDAAGGELCNPSRLEVR